MSLHSGETLHTPDEKSGTPLSIISCMKARKCQRKGHNVILALSSEKPSEEQRLEDIPIARDLPEVIPKKSPRLPPHVKSNPVSILSHEQRQLLGTI